MTHCIVKKTLDTIVDTKNSFVVAIKRNTKKLFENIEESVGMLTNCIDYNKVTETGHGRKETRVVHVFEASEEIKKYLSHINTVIRVKRIRQRGSKMTVEIAYYVSDLKLRAKQFQTCIRNHWSIENRLHWVKDMVMNEDHSNTRNKLITPILSIIKSLVVTIAYEKSKSVINFQRTNAHNIECMRLLLE